MSQNMNAVNANYEAAKKKYSELNDKLASGETYRESLKDAAEQSEHVAAARGAQAQAAARNAGMSRAVAAQMGADSRENGYMDAVGQQQNMALGTRTQAVGNQGSLLGTEQAEGQNRWNKSWSNLGRPLNMVGGVLQGISDENCKDAEKNNRPEVGSVFYTVEDMKADKEEKEAEEKDKLGLDDILKAFVKVGGKLLSDETQKNVNSSSKWGEVDAILKKHHKRNYSDLIIKHGDK